METPRDEHSPAIQKEIAAPPKDRPVRAQHEMLRSDLPKKDVAESLDEFDGDEA